MLAGLGGLSNEQGTWSPCYSASAEHSTLDGPLFGLAKQPGSSNIPVAHIKLQGVLLILFYPCQGHRVGTGSRPAALHESSRAGLLMLRCPTTAGFSESRFFFVICNYRSLCQRSGQTGLAGYSWLYCLFFALLLCSGDGPVVSEVFVDMDCLLL